MKGDVMADDTRYICRTNYGETGLCLLCGKVLESGEKYLAANLVRAWGETEYQICSGCVDGIKTNANKLK